MTRKGSKNRNRSKKKKKKKKANRTGGDAVVVAAGQRGDHQQLRQQQQPPSSSSSSSHRDAPRPARSGNNNRYQPGKRKRSFDWNNSRGSGGAGSVKNRNKGGGDGKEDGEGSAEVMDDVLAQLRLQRAKAKAEAEAEAKAASTDIATATVDDDDASNKDIDENTKKQQQHDQKRNQSTRMGKFRYDPIKRSYFPVSRRYDPHGVRTTSNDGFSAERKANNQRGQRGQDRDKKNYPTLYDQTAVHKAALRMATTRSRTRLDSNICAMSTKNALVHAYQMACEITNSTRRRHDMRSEMASALLSRGIRLVPTIRRVVVRDGKATTTPTSNSRNGAFGSRSREAELGQPTLNRPITRMANPTSQDEQVSDGDGTNNAPKQSRYKWMSLLKPLPLSRSDYVVGIEEGATAAAAGSRRGGGTPLDCVCKHELHPSTRTFDVMESSRGREDEMPHIVTISGGRQRNSIWYRGHQSIRNGPYSLGNNGSVDEVNQPSVGSNRRYQGVRFAPFMADNNRLPTAIFGELSTSRRGDYSSFALHRGPDETSVARPFVSSELRSNDSRSMPAYMNDFIFSPVSSASAPGVVAFAPGKRSGKRFFRPLFLDFETMRFIMQPKGWKFTSETLCVEHLDVDSPNTLLYGHRNGAVSLLDYRSNTFSYTDRETKVAFGSAMTLQSLGGYGSPYSFIVKGSFGSCCLYDVRKLGGDSNRMAPSLVHNMNISSSEGQETLASGCSGLAVHPSGTTLFSPCISGDRVPCIGGWCIATGKFMHAISLVPELRHNAYGKIMCGDVQRNYNEHTGSPFCELASTITRSIDWHGDESGKGLGAWIKFDPQLSAPCEGGGIHHVKFSCT